MAKDTKEEEEELGTYVELSSDGSNLAAFGIVKYPFFS